MVVMMCEMELNDRLVLCVLQAFRACPAPQTLGK